ncbi:MAG: hypothetical protein KIT16_20910, partial [Rhodospirillaceae bacterium]|nr:hypothetical protein [Rhodospirillaceae bacterium]
TDGVRQAFFENVGRSWSLYDRTRREAFFWAADADSLPLWERAEPLRVLIAWSLAGTGTMPVHGGAVGDARGALLLVGGSGAGKSSSVLACAGRLRLLGDDFVLVDSAQRAVRALYATAKLSADGLRRFPDLAPLVGDPRPGDDKAVFALGRVPGGDLADRLPLAATVLPRLGQGEASTVSEVGVAAALRALAPSSLLMVPGAGRDALGGLAAMAKARPCFALTLGADRNGVADALVALLDRVGSAQPPRRRRA